MFKCSNLLLNRSQRDEEEAEGRTPEDEKAEEDAAEDAKRAKSSLSRLCNGQQVAAHHTLLLLKFTTNKSVTELMTALLL